MADDFQLGSGNWWETSRTSAPASISTTLNAIASSYGWPTEMVDMKPRPCMADQGGSGGMPLQGGVGVGVGGSGDGDVLPNPNLHMMGLGLSSHSLDWNQALIRGEKGEGSFRSILQEDMSTTNTSNFQQESGANNSSQEQHWRNKLYSGASSEDSSVNEFKQTNRGFSLDQTHFSPQASSIDSSITSQQNLTAASFQVDSTAAAYGLLLSDNQHSGYENRPTMNYPYPLTGYGANAGVDQLMPSWNKFPQFLRNSPPKQAPPPPPPGAALHFTNNTPFWNAAAGSMNDGRSSFFPTMQTQIPVAPSFEEKPKNTSGVTTAKKNNSELSNKRPRNETPSPLPAFKVRKEKMGDRITALQQLVSPFGKTDTASVLSEAIEYIKFLHEQVNVLSTPYMKNGAPTQQQHQNCDKSKDPEGPRQDLRSRGLCLVPISSTFPVTHETTVDFWTPTFGGTFR